MMLIKIQSDIYYQIKPNKLFELKNSLDGPTRYLPYRFSKSVPCVREKNAIWAIHCLNFTHQEVHDLLKKATNIVESTEEYASYLLAETFGDQKNKKFFLAPGTIRFYSQDLICFFNGKTWKKLKP